MCSPIQYEETCADVRVSAVYMFAQLMGGIFGAALVYANYYQAINIYEGGRGIRTLKTAGFFGTYAVSRVHTDALFCH